MTPMNLESRKGLPISTIFMLMSLDGKISSGSSEEFDFDKDIVDLLGPSGLQQYYDLEKETDAWTLLSGKTMETMCRLYGPTAGPQIPVVATVVDNSHLSEEAYLGLLNRFEHVYLATSNPSRYADWGTRPSIIEYPYENPTFLFKELFKRGCANLTVQSGGTLNTVLVRAGLIDLVDVVLAPIIVGGKETPSIFAGAEVRALSDICATTLLSVDQLEHSYLRLRYRIEHK